MRLRGKIDRSIQVPFWITWKYHVCWGNVSWKLKLQVFDPIKQALDANNLQENENHSSMCLCLLGYDYESPTLRKSVLTSHGWCLLHSFLCFDESASTATCVYFIVTKRVGIDRFVVRLTDYLTVVWWEWNHKNKQKTARQCVSVSWVASTYIQKGTF